MIRLVAVLVGSLTFAVTWGPDPWAAADDGQSVRTQSGRVRCEVHANEVYHGSRDS